MAYQDPYAQNPYGREQQQQHAYVETQYNDQAAFHSNPSTEKMVDEEEYPANTARAQPGRSGLRQTTTSWADIGPPPRSTGILRMWRKDERGKQWTRGGGFRSSFRMICCCLMITVILVVSIILAVALYFRPPAVLLNDVTVGDTSVTTTGLSITLTLAISVINPNWFSMNFEKIKATASYPGTSGDLGGGTLYNVNFKGHSTSSFDFPFSFNYTSSSDSSGTILSDLVSKCSNDEDITIDYDLSLNMKILGITAHPSLSSSASFTCPIDASQIEKITGGS